MAAAFFAQLEEVNKPTPAVRLVIEGVGVLLGCREEELSSRHRVPPNSRYTPTVALLASSFAPSPEPGAKARFRAATSHSSSRDPGDRPGSVSHAHLTSAPRDAKRTSPSTLSTSWLPNTRCTSPPASAAPVLRDPGWFLTTKGASLSLFTSGGVKEARSPGASRGGRTTPQSTPQTVAGREER